MIDSSRRQCIAWVNPPLPPIPPNRHRLRRFTSHGLWSSIRNEFGSRTAMHCNPVSLLSINTWNGVCSEARLPARKQSGPRCDLLIAATNPSAEGWGHVNRVHASINLVKNGMMGSSSGLRCSSQTPNSNRFTIRLKTIS